jgi:hypothetical protein
MKKINDMLANANEGFRVGKTTVNKNGVDVASVAFCFENDKTICSVWYPQDSFWDLPDEAKVEVLKDAAAYIKKDAPDTDEIKDILCSENILDHVYPSLISEDNIEACRKAGTVVVQDKDSGLGIIFKIRLKNATVTVNKSLLPAMKIEESELRNIAFKNAEEEELFVKSLTNCMSGGLLTVENDPILVVSNMNKRYGSYAIFTEKVKREVAKYFGRNDYIVIPSSVHEILVVNVVNSEAVNIGEDEYSQLIQQVNADTLEDYEVLGTAPYFMRDGKLVKALSKAA